VAKQSDIGVILIDGRI